MTCVCGHHPAFHETRLVAAQPCILCGCQGLDAAPADGFEDIEWVNQHA